MPRPVEDETRDDSMIALALAEEVPQRAMPSAEDTSRDTLVAAALAQELNETTLTSTNTNGDHTTTTEDTSRDTLVATALAHELNDDAPQVGAMVVPTEDSRALIERISTDRRGSEPLAPRTAGEKPPAEEISEHRQRLLEHLRDFDLSEHAVVGDGACQFRALAHQLFGEEEKHPKVRKNVVDQLRKEADRYAPFVVSAADDGDDAVFENFVDKMAQPTTWGDHVTLQAAADRFHTRVCLLTSYAERPFVHVLPTAEHADDGSHAVDDAPHLPTVWLSFWAEVHYNSIKSYDQ